MALMGAKGQPKTGGRAPGVPNKVNRDIREMIRDALDGAGGVAYLIARAKDTPGPFLTLVGRIIPQQIDATIRRELPEMTRDQLLALLDSARVINGKGRVIEHKAEVPSAPQASIPAPKNGKA